MSKVNNACTLCGKPGIPGLIRGAGKCQYHWNLGVYGPEAADLARALGVSPALSASYGPSKAESAPISDEPSQEP